MDMVRAACMPVLLGTRARLDILAVVRVQLCLVPVATALQLDMALKLAVILPALVLRLMDSVPVVVVVQCILVVRAHIRLVEGSLQQCNDLKISGNNKSPDFQAASWGKFGEVLYDYWK